MASNPLYQGQWNFMGLAEAFSAPGKSRAWVLPIPYEGTTCYGANTREGPQAIIAASRQMEQYDYEFGCEPAWQYGIHTLPPLAPVRSSPDDMMDAVEDAVVELFHGRPRPELLCALGGEHSVSPGIARALRQVTPRDQLVSVQIDAHADLRNEYEGSAHSHACAAYDILASCPVFQIGIRNICRAEDELRRRDKRVITIFSEEANDPKGAFLKKLASFVRGKNVFLTIDLDGLDPSIMPAVGTPEPGGLSWERTLDIARVIAKHAARVPAFDVVELTPIPGLRAPDFLAAKLAFKIMSFVLLGAGQKKKQ